MPIAEEHIVIRPRIKESVILSFERVPAELIGEPVISRRANEWLPKQLYERVATPEAFKKRVEVSVFSSKQGLERAVPQSYGRTENKEMGVYPVRNRMVLGSIVGKGCSLSGFRSTMPSEKLLRMRDDTHGFFGKRAALWEMKLSEEFIAHDVRSGYLYAFAPFKPEFFDWYLEKIGSHDHRSTIEDSIRKLQKRKETPVYAERLDGVFTRITDQPYIPNSPQSTRDDISLGALLFLHESTIENSLMAQYLSRIGEWSIPAVESLEILTDGGLLEDMKHVEAYVRLLCALYATDINGIMNMYASGKITARRATYLFQPKDVDWAHMLKDFEEGGNDKRLVMDPPELQSYMGTSVVELLSRTMWGGEEPALSWDMQVSRRGGVLSRVTPKIHARMTDSSFRMTKWVEALFDEYS